MYWRLLSWLCITFSGILTVRNMYVLYVIHFKQTHDLEFEFENVRINRQLSVEEFTDSENELVKEKVNWVKEGF